jgi:hypothetical protein
MQNNSIAKMELKYCERCGGLWLRQQARSENVYCPRCTPEMLEMAVPRKKPPVSAGLDAIECPAIQGGAACA